MAQRQQSRKKSKAKKRWIAKVKTVSTYPPRNTFNGSAEQIARTMSRKGVSPKGLGSGIRMIQYFINRAGHNLPASRRAELEKAKGILHKKLEQQKGGKRKSKKRQSSS
jgi:Protein of unknown function (DUF3175)